MFSFASLQSKYAAEHLLHANGQNIILDSVVYQANGNIYTKSTAILKILHKMGGILRLADVFNLIPTSFLDRLYDFIAKNRYHWFGKKDQCMVPSAAIKSRFLD